jgi:hypothetical protein
MIVCCQAFACEFLSALTPSLCHAMPSSTAPGIAGGSCHFFAVGGVFQKFLRWIQGSVSLPIVVPAPRLGCFWPANEIVLGAPASCGNHPRLSGTIHIGQPTGYREVPRELGYREVPRELGTGRFLARRAEPTSASAPILAEPCLRHLQRRGLARPPSIGRPLTSPHRRCCPRF